MKALAAAALWTLLLPLFAAAPGGDACQVASSAVPTPGLPELVMGSMDNPVPDDARLTQAQIKSLAQKDTQIRRAMDELEARFRKLPAGDRGVAEPELAARALPELVAHFLASASREQALLIDVESADEFQLANDDAVKAEKNGEKSRCCALCLAVRRGMEAKFQWRAGELGTLTPAQEKEAAELASLREDLRRKWAATVQTELSPTQVDWLRRAQLRWLKSTLRTSVASGLRSLGAKKCEACSTESAPKCVFCSIVINAVADAKDKI